MNHKHLAWTLITIGAIWEGAMLLGSYDATVTGAAVTDTLTGKIDAYFEQINPLPIDIGTTLLLVGAGILGYDYVKAGGLKL